MENGEMSNTLSRHRKSRNVITEGPTPNINACISYYLLDTAGSYVHTQKHKPKHRVGYFEVSIETRERKEEVLKPSNLAGHVSNYPSSSNS